MTYVSCFYHAFQGAMQVNVKSLKMTNSFFFTWITLETTKLRPYCRYIFNLVCDVWNYYFFEFSDLAASAMPDDRAIMTYVSSYYHTFAGAQKVWMLTNTLSYLMKVQGRLILRKICCQYALISYLFTCYYNQCTFLTFFFF